MGRIGCCSIKPSPGCNVVHDCKPGKIKQFIAANIDADAARTVGRATASAVARRAKVEGGRRTPSITFYGDDGFRRLNPSGVLSTITGRRVALARR
jgi:hypothetical protein